MPTDAELINRTRQGDMPSFQALVERYQARVYTVILGMWSDPQEAEELAQDTFVQAYRALGEFRGESSFPTWLYRIAVNICQGHRRKTLRRRTIAPQELTPPEDMPERASRSGDPEGRILEDLELSELRRQLNGMPEQHRLPLYMHYFAGQSYKEMAGTLGISVKGVEARMARAREALRQRMSGGVSVG